MARKAFDHFEAVSAVVPVEGGYNAAIAVKAIDGTGTARFHTVLEGQIFKTANEADLAAAKELTHLKDVKENTDLLW
ncbi:MAG: hypothetical protein ABWY46_16025 [Pseudomonas sp.]|jgi:hypothetical protein